MLTGDWPCPLPVALRVPAPPLRCISLARDIAHFRLPRVPRRAPLRRGPAPSGRHFAPPHRRRHFVRPAAGYKMGKNRTKSGKNGKETGNKRSRGEPQRAPSGIAALRRRRSGSRRPHRGSQRGENGGLLGRAVGTVWGFGGHLGANPGQIRGERPELKGWGHIRGFGVTSGSFGTVWG